MWAAHTNQTHMLSNVNTQTQTHTYIQNTHDIHTRLSDLHTCIFTQLSPVFRCMIAMYTLLMFLECISKDLFKANSISNRNDQHRRCIGNAIIVKRLKIGTHFKKHSDKKNQSYCICLKLIKSNKKQTFEHFFDSIVFCDCCVYPSGAAGSWTMHRLRAPPSGLQEKQS